MKAPMVILALLGAAGCATAEPVHPAKRLVAYFGEYCGTNYAQRVSEQDLGHFVRWDPAAEPCALAMTNAIALASAALPVAFPGSEWRFGAVALHELRDGDDLWHYLVYFRMTKPSGYGYFHVVVSPTGWIPPFEVARKEEFPCLLRDGEEQRPERKPPDSEQTDGETTSKTAPSAVPEASHP